MIYLVAIFMPPLYFLIKRKWGGFLLSSLICLLGLGTLILGVGFVFYAAASIHAVYDLKKDTATKQIDLIAQKTAEKLKEAERASKETNEIFSK